jgi:hypothetical protein
MLDIPVKPFLVNKNCDSGNPLYTNVLTYTISRFDGAALNSFFSFDQTYMLLKVGFLNEVGTHELVVRGTLSNGQTAHETFTVIILP